MNFVLLMYLDQRPEALDRLLQAVATVFLEADGRERTDFMGFSKALHAGIFMRQGEEGLNSLRLSFPQTGRLTGLPRLTLTLEGIFSPALRTRLQPLAPGEAATLRGLYEPYEGDSGYSTAAAGQPTLAEAGRFVVAALNGQVIWRPRDGDETAGVHAETQRKALRSFLLGWLDRVQPTYAFITNQEDFQLWHEGDMAQFPPPDPWRYVWSLMVYGTQLAREGGLPGTVLTDLHGVVALSAVTPGGLAVIQPFDFLLHPHEQHRLADARMGELHLHRQRALKTLQRYLDVALPYSTFL